MKNKKGSSETTREITNKNFYNWFIGFLEGDGSFYIRSNNTLGFEIYQKTADAQILYYIKTNLGFGKVYHNSKNNMSRFTIANNLTSYSHFTNFLNVEDLRLIKRKNQYDTWILKLQSLINSGNNSVSPEGGAEQGLNLESTIRKDPSWEDSWLSGFIDAEGCFRIHLDNKTNRYRPIFQITQDEEEIMLKIKGLFGNKHRGSLIKDRGTYLLMISGKDARELLINYIERFPLKTQKRIAFDKWKECHKLSLMAPSRVLQTMDISQEDKILTQLKLLKESINKY